MTALTVKGLAFIEFEITLFKAFGGQCWCLQTTTSRVNRIGDGVQGVTVAEFLHAKGGPMARSSIKTVV